MTWLFCLLVVLGKSDQGAAEATDWMKPPSWKGNFWGPAATRARLTGQLPSLPTNAAMKQSSQWGRNVLRDGDIVFRLGDARALHGTFPLSRFIARATGSPFSHTGIVAVEDGSPVVYDCSSDGVQRQPFEVWMLDCVGAMGVKRLKPEHRHRIPGVLGFCRSKFEQQVPFDFEFRLGRCRALLCRADRKSVSLPGFGALSAGPDRRLGPSAKLSDDGACGPVCHQADAEATDDAGAARLLARQRARRRVGVTLARDGRPPGTEIERAEAAIAGIDRPKLQGDLELALFAAGEVRRAYAELQAADQSHNRRVVSNDDRPAQIPSVAIDAQVAQQSR